MSLIFSSSRSVSTVQPRSCWPANLDVLTIRNIKGEENLRSLDYRVLKHIGNNHKVVVEYLRINVFDTYRSEKKSVRKVLVNFTK